MERNNLKIKLPLFETLGTIMANHTLKTGEEKSIVSYEDLMFIKFIINANLDMEFEEDEKVPQISIKAVFKNEEEKEKATKEYPYADLVGRDSFLNEQRFPNEEFMKGKVRELAKIKSEKKGAEVYEHALWDEVRLDIKTDFDYADKYAQWAQNLVDAIKATGANEEEIVEFVEESIKNYGDNGGLFCRDVLELLSEKNKKRLLKKYKDKISSKIVAEGIDERDIVYEMHKIWETNIYNNVSFGKNASRAVEFGLKQITDVIYKANNKLNKEKIRDAVERSFNAFERYGFIRMNYVFCDSAMKKKLKMDEENNSKNH